LVLKVPKSRNAMRLWNRDVDTWKVVMISRKGRKDFGPGRSGYFGISTTEDLNDIVRKGERLLRDSPNREKSVAYYRGPSFRHSGYRVLERPGVGSLGVPTRETVKCEDPKG
jgi:hypothetical protein